jgi:uncharacterized protein
MKTVFADTSGWLAIVVKSDSLHEKAVKIHLRLLKSGYKPVIHEAILLEIGNSLSSVKARNIAVKLKENIENSSRIEVISLMPELIERRWKLYAERTDKDWGIVDCISFVVMNDFGITEALTADRHFKQAGFTKLL